MESPVATYIRGTIGQLEGEGSSIGAQVGVAGCEVESIGLRPLTHFHLRREHMRRVVIYVSQVNLKGACPTGRGGTCKPAAMLNI